MATLPAKIQDVVSAQPQEQAEEIKGDAIAPNPTIKPVASALAAQDPGKSDSLQRCSHCNSENVILHGQGKLRKDGSQATRYFCHNCKKTFSVK